MTEQDVLIYLVKVGIPVATFLFGLFKWVTTPLNELTSAVIKLEATIIALEKHNNTQDRRINRHSEEIDSHNKILENHNTRISSLENRECRYELSQKLNKGE